MTGTRTKYLPDNLSPPDETLIILRHTIYSIGSRSNNPRIVIITRNHSTRHRTSSQHVQLYSPEHQRPRPHSSIPHLQESVPELRSIQEAIPQARPSSVFPESLGKDWECAARAAKATDRRPKGRHGRRECPREARQPLRRRRSRQGEPGEQASTLQVSVHTIRIWWIFRSRRSGLVSPGRRRKPVTASRHIHR